MKKKLLAVIIVISMAIGISGLTAYAYTSTPSDWAVDPIYQGALDNLVPQTLLSSYSKPITRAEFCSLVVLLYEKMDGEISDRTVFVDTEDVNVEKAAAIGVVQGVGLNHFFPEHELTREQAAVMLSRLAEVVGSPFEPFEADFVDMGDVSDWAVESVGLVQGAGIMGGVGLNHFLPQGIYTREQGMVTIKRVYDELTGAGGNVVFDNSGALPGGDDANTGGAEQGGDSAGGDETGGVTGGGTSGGATGRPAGGSNGGAQDNNGGGTPGDTGGAANSSGVGLWFCHDNTVDEYLHLKASGGFDIYTIHSDGKPTMIISGKYTLTGDRLVMSDFTIDGVKNEGEFPFTFVVDGDTAYYQGTQYTRLPESELTRIPVEDTIKTIAN